MRPLLTAPPPQERRKNNVSLRYNEEYRRRIELISDFDMPTDSSRVKISRDGAFVFATGTYPPRVKIYETAEVCPLSDFLPCSLPTLTAAAAAGWDEV